MLSRSTLCLLLSYADFRRLPEKRECAVVPTLALNAYEPVPTFEPKTATLETTCDGEGTWVKTTTPLVLASKVTKTRRESGDLSGSRRERRKSEKPSPQKQTTTTSKKMVPNSKWQGIKKPNPEPVTWGALSITNLIIRY